jgi:hypothetical protein
VCTLLVKVALRVRTTVALYLNLKISEWRWFTALKCSATAAPSQAPKPTPPERASVAWFYSALDTPRGGIVIPVTRQSHVDDGNMRKEYGSVLGSADFGGG